MGLQYCSAAEVWLRSIEESGMNETTQASSSAKKNLLSIGALILSLAALQSPLWRPHNAIHVVTVEAGTSAVISCDRDIERAGILEKSIATPTFTNPRRLVVHGKTPGRTTLIICSKDGTREMCDVVVKSTSASSSGGLILSR